MEITFAPSEGLSEAAKKPRTVWSIRIGNLRSYDIPREIRRAFQMEQEEGELRLVYYPGKAIPSMVGRYSLSWKVDRNDPVFTLDYRVQIIIQMEE